MNDPYDLKCDGDPLGCTAPLTFECNCGRCARESDPSEKFRCCIAHKAHADMRHVAVRERPAFWVVRSV
jgi:hypothetical protein